MRTRTSAAGVVTASSLTSPAVLCRKSCGARARIDASWPRVIRHIADRAFRALVAFPFWDPVAAIAAIVRHVAAVLVPVRRTGAVGNICAGRR